MYLILPLIIFIIIIIFTFPQISPIPYFPSNKKDKSVIIQSLNLKNDQIIFDLGAGDGWVIFEAAQNAYQQNLNTKFIATEINIILLLILYIRKLLHPNKRNIQILYADMFRMNFDNVTMKQCNNVTIYLYISPWYLEKTITNIKKQLKNFNVVSYMYPIKSFGKKVNIKEGLNKIYIYNCSK